MTPVTVLLVEDFVVLADGLTAIINDEPDLHVVGCAGSVAEAIALADALEPDVVVLDYRLPDGTGADAASAIRRRHPDAVLLFLSRFEGDVMRLAAFEAGASGYLNKRRAAADVVQAIRAVARGEVLIRQHEMVDLIHTRRQTSHLVEHLTIRELEVLARMARGVDAHQIAQQLDIRYSTVRGHVRNVLMKMNVHTQLEAVARAVELGLVESLSPTANSRRPPQ